MAQISLVKTLVLSYMELQRQIDRHPMDAPSYLVKGWREEQEAILASLEAKPPTELDPDGATMQFSALIKSQGDDSVGV